MVNRPNPVRSKSAAATAIGATNSPVTDISSTNVGRSREAKSEVGHGRHERNTSLRREERQVRAGADGSHTSSRRKKDRSQTRAESTLNSKLSPTPTPVKEDKARPFVQVGRGGAGSMVELIPSREDRKARGERSHREHDYSYKHELVRKTSRWRLWKSADDE